MLKRLRIWILMVLMWLFSVHSIWAAGNTVYINGQGVLGLPEWGVQETAVGGKLLLSDSPEEFTDTGILYSDVVEGDTRLFYHHVNGMLYNKKVAVVLENVKNQPVKVILYRKGISGPGKDYLAVGKAAQQKYFDKQEVCEIIIPAHQAVLLDGNAAEVQVRPQELVNGIYDFIAEGPVRLQVMSVGSFADPLKEYANAKVLPADAHHLRGTFPYADRLMMAKKVFDASKDGPHVITLGDGRIDKFITGIDATDGSSVLNYGNYGVAYKVFMATTAGGSTDLQLNPRGGVYAGALGLKVNGQNLPVIGTPGDRIWLESSDTAANVVKLQPESDFWIRFMPPGASNLPVKLILTPEKK